MSLRRVDDRGAEGRKDHDLLSDALQRLRVKDDLESDVTRAGVAHGEERRTVGPKIVKVDELVAVRIELRRERLKGQLRLCGEA